MVPSIRPQHSLQFRIIFSALLIFVATLWSLSFFASRELRKDMERVLGEQQLCTVSMVAAHIEFELDERLKILETIATLSARPMREGAAAMQDYIEQRPTLHALFNLGVFVTGVDGVVVADFPSTTGRYGLNLMDRDYILSTLVKGKTTVGRPITGKAVRAPVFVMAAPIRDTQGKVIGALAGSTSLDATNFLDQIMASRHGKTDSYLLVSPRDRLIVTATDKHRIMETLPPLGSSPATDRLIDGREGTVVTIDAQSGESLVSAKSIPAAGWLAVAALPTSEAFAPIRDMQLRMVLVTLLLTALASCGARYLLKRQLSPLLETAEALAAMSDTGRPLQPLPIARPDEIGRLIGGFNRLIAVLAERESSLKNALRFRQDLVEAVPSPIFYKDAAFKYLGGNRAFGEYIGLAPEQYIGKTVYDIAPPDLAEKYAKADCELLANPGVQTYESSVVYADGSRHNVIFNKATFNDAEGRVAGLIGFIIDITSLRQAEEEIGRLAFFDMLTGLPNRRLLLDRLGQALSVTARHQNEGALLFIDLDNFKTINDNLGHDKGDLLLQQVAQRLTASVRQCDTVARLGGDEFVVMLEDLSDNAPEAATQARIVGEKIIAAFDRNFLIDGLNYHCTASIGISLFTGRQGQVDDLLKQADLAMYHSKESGRNTLSFFDPKMQAAVTARAALEAAMHDAITNGQLVLFFQPQINATGRVIGAEALVRWRHPEQGLVYPDDFLKLLKETRLIQPIAQWVLNTACRQLAAWTLRPATAHLTLAINIDKLQLHHEDFVNTVLTALAQSGAPPQQLVLELDESILLDNLEENIAKIKSLKAKGVRFAVDKFGFSISSLAHVKRLPLDQLKIDRTFIQNVLVHPIGSAIAKMIVEMAESLGMLVIAVGVEAEEQKEILARHGCHAYQCDPAAPPMPVGEFEAFVEHHANASEALVV